MLPYVHSIYYKLYLWRKRAHLKNKSAIFWQRIGQKNALHIFHQAARRVPAYSKFLRDHEINPSLIRTIKDFVKVPSTSKENYINKYSFSELCWDGKVDGGLSIAQSSGTSGTPLMWARSYRNEVEAAIIQQIIFEDSFRIQRVPVLFVVCFHLGSHIAGMITVDAIKRMLEHGVLGALITPGLNQEDVLQLIGKLWPYYQQIVLIGYPPFIKDIIDAGKERGLVWQEKTVNLIVSGEAISESWRERVAKTLHQPPYRIINLYGSADIGLMGFETVDTLAVRRLATTDKNILTLFGSDSEYIPPIYQFDPSSRYFEESNSELLCTVDNALPLVRYNLHDMGRVVWGTTIAAANPKMQTNSLQSQLPFISILGRSNYMVTFYALNIYPEHIREILNQPDVSTKVSGRFFLKVVYNNEQNQNLEIFIEAAPHIEPSESWAQSVRQDIVHGLCALNREYKKLYGALGERVQPIIKGSLYGSEVFRANKTKYKYIAYEKK